MGIPTVTIATTEFLPLARNTMEGRGLADMAFVAVPHPMGMIPLNEIRAKADNAFPDILKAATAWKPTRTTIPGLGKKPYPAERIKFKGTYESVYNLFWGKGWTPGLPIVPPTTEAVQAMLKGTSHKPSEVVWNVPPREGVLTVELVAVHAVMAGCKPEHMPVLLAIIDAMRDEKFGWRGQTTTTNPTAPLVIVNGPIRDELRIAYGTGAAGGWYRPNVCLGIAINLIGDIVGGSKPPSLDKSTLGQVGNIIATVIGENEKENPWGPYHVEKGFGSTDNVVTLFDSVMPTNNVDHASVEAKDLAENLAYTMNNAGQNSHCFYKNQVVWVISPEHAVTLYRGFKTKADLQKFLWEKARVPLWSLPPWPGVTGCKPPDSFGPYTDDSMIPVTDKPEGIQIIVSGGAGKHSQYFQSFTNPIVMHKIDPWR